MIALKLYDVGSIHVSEFYQSNKRVILQASEEFNIEYCLVKIRDIVGEVDRIKEFTVDKTGNEVNLSFEKMDNEIKTVETIEMSDLIFKAVK